MDFAADLRAPTPSAAAEKAVPVRAELVERTAAIARRFAEAERRLLDGLATRLSTFQRLLASPDQVLATPRQRRDLARERLRTSWRAGLDRRRLRLSRAAQILARHAPDVELARAGERLKGLSARLRQGLLARIGLAKQARAAAQQRLDGASGRLARAVAAKTQAARARLAQLEQLRQSFGHASVLARGFALVRDASNRLVRNAAEIKRDQELSLQFADGEVSAKALGVKALGVQPVGKGLDEAAARKSGPRSEKSRLATKRKTRYDDQGSLF